MSGHERLSFFNESHMVDIILYIRDHPECRQIELYRYVARNDRMPVKLGILMDIGIVEDLSEEYHISTLRLTPVGEKVAEHLQAIADLLDDHSS